MELSLTEKVEWWQAQCTKLGAEVDEMKALRKDHEAGNRLMWKMGILLTAFFVATILYLMAAVASVEAGAKIWTVNCPNTDESYQNFPHSTVYSGGRLEIQWAIDVLQPVNYEFVFSSLVPFETVVKEEQGGRWREFNFAQRSAQFDRGRFTYHVRYNKTGSGQTWLWVIIKPHLRPNDPKEFLVTGWMQCSGAATAPAPAQPVYPQQGCQWVLGPGTFGQGSRDCVCDGRPAHPSQCR